MVLDETQVYLPELWATYASSQPTKTAVVCGARRQTWRELNESMNRIANRLLSAGVGRGDKIAVLMSNAIETLHAMLGVVKAGACVVPISTLLTPEQVATLLDDSGAVGLFVSDATRATADDALRANTVLRSDLRIVVGTSASGWDTLAAWLGDVPAGDPDVRYAMEDEFNIIYSSGTTGLPKGIVQTHRARQHWSYSNALEMRFDNTAVALTTTSLYSNGTMFMVLPPLFVGGTIVIMPSFSVDAFFEAVAREGVTHTFMVPTQIAALLESPALESSDLHSLRTLVSAGSPLRDEVKRQAQRSLCRGLFELYGFTEGFATMIKPEDLERKPGSVGKPVLGFEFRILSDDGRELPAGEIGEIAGYGGGLMKQYWRKPEATEEATWRDSRGRTFVRSGDIGRTDEDGFLYILDRKKDMILSGGFNVFPKDIEEVVARHPDVADVTVIGVPHPKWGETPLALVIAKPGRAVDPPAIREWANERLSKTQRLSGVEQRSEFPRNALGKVLKRVLREPYWSARSA